MSNKKQTALQLLISELEEQVKTCPMSHRKFYLYCKMLATQKLKIEKQQIIDTYISGKVNGVATTIGNEKNKHSEQYYKETYGND